MDMSYECVLRAGEGEKGPRLGRRAVPGVLRFWPKRTPTIYRSGMLAMASCGSSLAIARLDS